ncbi:MAG: NAD-dependent epimerase/dehydratase family protein [Pseudomonadota bacterium]
MSHTAHAQLLVTGASGFLGRTIVKRAKAHGLTSVGTTRADIDQNDPAALADLIDTINPNYAIDAAGILPGRGDLQDNVALTRSWLEAIRRALKPPRLVLIGSAAVYGTGSAQDRATREDDPMQPVSDYGRAKLDALQLGRHAFETDDLDVQTGIVFNLIGQGQPDNLAPQVFIRNAVDNAGGEQTVGRVDTIRDFTDVEDAADALIAMAQRGQSGDVLNVASGQPTRIRDLLDKLSGMLGTRWVSDAEQARAGEIDVCYGDPSRLLARTGWSPKHNFDDALIRAIEAARAASTAKRRA